MRPKVTPALRQGRRLRGHQRAGATNLVTPIADAWMDSTPLVAVTGQVSTAVLGKDAFQEIDITGITMPITKHNYLVKKSKSCRMSSRKRFTSPARGRPGPVLVDVCKDAQQSADRARLERHNRSAVASAQL